MSAQQAQLRAMMRRGTVAAPAAETVALPASLATLLRVDDGRAICRVCALPLGFVAHAAALWKPHTQSRVHVEALAMLAQRAAMPSKSHAQVTSKTAQSTSVLPEGFFDAAPSTTSKRAPSDEPASVAAPAALPVGFFDNADDDARARGEDPRARAAAAAEAEWSAFESFAADVAADADAAEVAAEAVYAARGADEALESAMYKARVDVAKFARDKLRAASAASGAAVASAAGLDSDNDGEATAAVAGSELAEAGGLTLLTVPNAAAVTVGAVEVLDLLRKRMAGERAPAPKRARVDGGSGGDTGSSNVLAAASGSAASDSVDGVDGDAGGSWADDALDWRSRG